jgi:hypothetical protein
VIYARPSVAVEPSTTGDIEACPGGGAAGAVLALHDITTVRRVDKAGDSVTLVPTRPGCMQVLVNQGKAAMDVYARGDDTINGVAVGRAAKKPAAGLSQKPGTAALYVCTEPGAWARFLQS